MALIVNVKNLLTCYRDEGVPSLADLRETRPSPRVVAHDSIDVTILPDFSLRVKTTERQGLFYDNDEFYLSPQDVLKFPHEFAWRLICKTPERTMSEIMPNIPIEFANKTPDLCFKTDGDQIHILEFGTKRLGIKKSAENYAHNKILKYSPIVEYLNRSGLKCRLDVMIVTRHSVFSTFTIDEDLATALCWRYMTAISQLDELRRRHPEFSHHISTLYKVTNVPANMAPLMQYLTENEEKILSTYKNTCFNVVDCPFNKTDVYNMAVSHQQSLNKQSPVNKPTINDLVDPNGRVDHSDTISRYPLIVPTSYGFEAEDFEEIEWEHMEHEYECIWGSALSQYNADPQQFKTYNEVPEGMNPEEFVSSLQNLDSKAKRRKNRLTITCNNKVMQSLAKIGLWGKKYRRNAEIIAKRKFSQKHVDCSTTTNDIEKFIESFPDKIEKSDIEKQPISVELLKHATPQTKWDPHKVYESLKDNVYVSLLFIAELTREIACSASQSCQSNQFILKKLPNWDALVLIKPTKSHQHTFFSLIVRVAEDLNEGNVFPTGIEICNDIRMYSFKSLQIPMMESALRLPEMYLACKYNCSGISKQALLKNLAAGILLALDNKADSEEVMTKMRYIIMKGTTLPKTCRNPWAVLSGMPSRPRSRLTLFLLKRAIILCDRVLDMRSLGTEDNFDHWENIPNFVSDDYVDNWEEVLTLMYTGYFRNKNSYTSGNQSMAMLEKITAPELEYQMDPDYKSRVLAGDAPYPQKMEWNSGFLNFCVEQWEKMSRKRGIDDPQKEITDAFLINLSKVKTVDLATLKASNVDLEESEYVIGKKNKRRKKVLIVLKESISQFGVDMTTALPKALEIVSKRGGTMMISLFKKPQHAGLREIYVMDLSSRIIQFCIELLGRTLCETFPSEAMTHPDVKLSYRQDHLKKVDTVLNNIRRSSPNSDLVAHTAYDNDDAKKWNQYQHVQKFTHMLCKMTDQRLHSFIRVGLSMWRNKRIRMDDELLNSMANSNYSPKSADAQEIVYGFQGRKETPIVQKGMCDIHVDSGMMQGLLHFTSSALHALSLLGYDALLKEYILHQRNYLRDRLRDKKLQMMVINTHAVTSDDSISANTIISNAPVHYVVQYGLTACSALKLACANMLGIISSKEKASLCTAPISEFNSQWMDRKEIVRPRMRHILACFTYSSAGNFMEQQDNFTSLRQQALESGVCIQQVSLINFLQGLYYYRMAGSGNSPVFELMKEKLMRVPDPNAGFFLMDPPLLSGIVSTDYNTYMLAQRSFLGCKYNRSYNEENILAGSSGSLRSATSLTIEFTNVKKFRELVNSIQSQEVLDKIKENPELLFRQPITNEESELHIAMKLMTPNVLKSLSRDFNCMARELAASVYLFWAPIAYTNIDAMRIITGQEPISKKRSIFDVMNEQEPYILYAAQRGYNALTKQTKQLFFPLHEQFDQLSKVNADLEDRISRKQLVEPRSATSIEIIEGKFNDIPLMKLCAYKWFNLRDMDLPSTTLDIYWEEAKDTYPFLRDTFYKTLFDSGLDNPIQLRNALDRTTKKGKIIRPTSRGGRGVRSTGTSTFVSYNFLEGEVLKVKSTDYFEDQIRRHLRRICMTLQLPFSNERKALMILGEINKINFNDLKHHSRFAPLALVHKALVNRGLKISLKNAAKLCRSHNTLIGTWIRPQMRIGGKWLGDGIWKGYFIHNGKFAKTEIKTFNDKVIYIMTDNLEVLQQCSARLNTIFKSWNVEPVIESNIRASSFFNRDFGPSHGCPVYVGSISGVDVEMLSTDCNIIVEGKKLKVMHKGIAIYDFVARSDLVAECEVDSSNIMEHILNNSPIPVHMVTRLLMSENLPDHICELKPWIISLLQQKTILDRQTQDEFVRKFNLEEIYEEMAKMECLSALSSALMEPLDPELEEVTELAIATELDDYDERMRLFEYQSDCYPTVNSSHYMFLKKFLNYTFVLVRNVKTGQTMLSQEDRFVYELMTGETIEPEENEDVMWGIDPLETSSVASDKETDSSGTALNITGFSSSSEEQD